MAIYKKPLFEDSTADSNAIYRDNSQPPTADISWDDNDLVDVEKLGVGGTAPGSHSLAWIENTNIDEHPNVDIVSVQTDRQPGLRFRVDELTTPGYAIGGIRGFWDGNQVARVDLVRSDDADAEGPNQNKNEGYISFSVKKEGVARAVVLKLDETGSLEFQDESNYDTDLKWAGSGQILASDNTFVSPAYSFASDTDTGFWNQSANQINFTTGGQDRMNLTTTQLNLNVDLDVQSGKNIVMSAETADTLPKIDGSKELVSSGISIDSSDNLSGVGNLQADGQVYSSQDTETQAASATHTIDWNDGNSTEWDLQAATGDITLTLSNPQAGASYLIKIIQGSTARNITWPANVKWPGGTAPTITATNDAIDLVSLYYDGTDYLAVFNQDFQ